MNFLKYLSFPFLAIAILNSANAQSVLIDFDSDVVIDQPISSGYKGLNWDNFFVLDGIGQTNNGYNYGTISPNNVSYNAWGNPASFSSTNVFTLKSGYFTAAWNNGIGLTVVGSKNSIQRYSQTYTLSNTTPLRITFNWSDINSVLFSTSDNTQFALDDLTISYGPSVADTQQSLLNSASILQGTYTLQNSILANSFSYDCSVFGKNGVCVSAGGRNTAVQAANGLNNTSGLLIASYRLNKNNSRIGAYVDQNLSVTGPGTVQLGNNTPLIGLFGVWSERPDGVGAEVKVSAAYGQKSTTVNRQVVGTSEAGSGGSDLISQGAQVVGKYGFAVLPDTVVSPYVGVRYTQNNMGGYTEATSTTVTVPLTYGALNTNATTALAGAEARYRGIPKTILLASAGVETDTNTANGSYNATNTSIGTLTPINFNPNPVRTRPTATLGAFYDVAKNQRLGLTGIYRQEPFQAVSTTTVMATYTIGL